MKSILGGSCGVTTRWDPSALFTCWRAVTLSLLASSHWAPQGSQWGWKENWGRLSQVTVEPFPCPLAGWILSASPVFQEEIRRVFSVDTQVCPTSRGIATGEGSQHGTQFMAYLDHLPLNHEKQLVFSISLDVQQTCHSFLIQES